MTISLIQLPRSLAKVVPQRLWLLEKEVAIMEIFYALGCLLATAFPRPTPVLKETVDS